MKQADERIVVIGASAGGVDALSRIARELPGDFSAPICMVLHVSPDAPSLLPDILRRDSRLQVIHAEDGRKLERGFIYVAPPDRHVLVEINHTMRVVRGPRENRHRPAIDPLFRSAAAAYGAGAVGVILTGNLDDGTAGMVSIRRHGGRTIVQDPRDAAFPSMPQSVLRHMPVDQCVPLTEIVPALLRSLNGDVPPPQGDGHMDLDRTETKIVEMEEDAVERDDRPGTPSAFSCPECGGVLWEIRDEKLTRYRCRVGHAYSPEAMRIAQDERLEESLWTAMKTLEESARLSRRLAQDERSQGHKWLVQRFEERENDARRHAEILRRFLLDLEPESGTGG
jgi:two-component system chemotaxis response regulator CheB